MKADQFDLEAGLADFVRFHEQHIAPRVHAPRREWMDLESGFARIAAELNAESRPARSSDLRDAMTARGRRWRGAAGLFAIGAAAAATFWFEARREKPAVPVPSRVVVTPREALPPARVIVPEATAPVRDRNVEVRIIAILHRIGADLGDPIDVELLKGRWKVRALELSAERSELLRQSFSGLAGVDLILDSAAVAGAPDRPAPAVSGERSGNRLIFADQLEQYFGSRAALTVFTDRAFDRSQAILARAHALQSLDRRFPVAGEMELGVPERETLTRIRKDHLEAVAELRSGLASDFGLLSKALEPASCGPSSARTPLLKSSIRWDRALGVVLGGAATGLSPQQLHAELCAAFTELDQSIGAAR